MVSKSLFKLPAESVKTGSKVVEFIKIAKKHEIRTKVFYAGGILLSYFFLY